MSKVATKRYSVVLRNSDTWLSSEGSPHGLFGDKGLARLRVHQEWRSGGNIGQCKAIKQPKSHPIWIESG